MVRAGLEGTAFLAFAAYKLLPAELTAPLNELSGAGSFLQSFS